MMMGWHWHQDISFSVRNYYLKLRQSFCGGNCKEVLYYIILDFCIYISQNRVSIGKMFYYCGSKHNFIDISFYGLSKFNYHTYKMYVYKV